MTLQKRLNKELGNAVESFRKERKLSQNQLAKKSGVYQTSISRAEKNGCGLELAEKLLKAMGGKIGINHLTYGDEKSATSVFMGGIEAH